jgi:ribosomal protein S18 acetylase RimI-like enzyme
MGGSERPPSPPRLRADVKSALRRVPIAIRAYDGARDAQTLRALNIEHQDFSRALEPSWPEGTAVVDQYVAFLEKECAAHDGCVLLAESRGGVVGFVCVVASTRGDSPDDPATFAWIHDIFVSPEHRRRGVATALMAAAEAFARSRGADELRLGVIERNTNARELYRGLGFRDYTRVLTKPLD